MLTQGFGEVITDVLTINPALALIPGVSSILDTSNFTFYAVSLGKDSQGYQTHAHYLLSPFTGTLPNFLGIGYTGLQGNSGYVLSRRFNSTSPSSYHSSSTQIYFSSTYTSVPSYPSVYDIGLDKSSKSGFEVNQLIQNEVIFLSALASNPALKDFGHYKNVVIDKYSTSTVYLGLNLGIIFNVSGMWNLIGSYPPSGNSSIYMLVDSNGSFVTSGNLSGVFNTQGVVDVNGFIRINPSVNAIGASAGPMMYVSSLASNPSVYVQVPIQMGDAAALALFGGVNHIGLWCLDLKEMLKDGLMPPYSWSNVNTNRKYKLVAKSTFWNDILLNDDVGGISGLKRLADGTGYTRFKGPCVVLQIKFN